MKKGFTLVELLVVVIIVAVLTRIALPQYRRVVQKARVAEAQAMLRTLYDSSERLAVEFGAKDYQALYNSPRQNRATIARMDMFDQTQAGTQPQFVFACTVKDFGIKCKHWNYTLVTTAHNTKYVWARDSHTEIGLERSTMKWVCCPRTGLSEGAYKVALQNCMSYDIDCNDASPRGDYSVLD